MIDHYKSGDVWILDMYCDWCHVSGHWVGLTEQGSQLRAYVEGWRVTPANHQLCGDCAPDWKKCDREIKRKAKAYMAGEKTSG